MEEPEINRMSLTEYRAWSDAVWHGTDAEISARADQLYDKLTQGLHVQVVSSSASSMSYHILVLIDASKKIPQVNHCYHYTRVHPPHATAKAITTVISQERLNSQFAMILADIVENLLK